MKKNTKHDRNIFFVKPFCVRSHMDFLDSNNFDPRFIESVPNSESAFTIAENALNQVISSVSRRGKIFTTKDGIKACKSENIFVKISSTCLLGCTYTDDGTILDGCINGNRALLYEHCIELASGTEPDEIFDDEICPLLRIYSMSSCYHFMFEVLDKIMIAKELGFRGKYMIFRNQCADFLLKLLKIDKDRIIWVNYNNSGKLFLLKKVFDIEGFTLSSKKSLSRLNRFADNAAITLSEAGNYPSKILIDENSKNAPSGFEVISPSKYSSEQIAKFFYHADIVESHDNPCIANILFMRRGTEVINKFPDNWGSLLSDIISLRGLQYKNI